MKLGTLNEENFEELETNEMYKAVTKANIKTMEEKHIGISGILGWLRNKVDYLHNTFELFAIKAKSKF